MFIYYNCTDILKVCQAYSEYCVLTNSVYKVITLCDNYDNVFSCTLGINDTQCGWFHQVNAKITQYIVIQMMLTYQHVLVGVLLVFQMELNVLIKELVFHIQSLQVVKMKY
ncbi:unnamed protein product [Paramecium primaurelia]|uniref:Transmembrane protein n=1 Tax=Paramecium primaurelia TaxID=5886 RepID=A0A8S1NAT2_PARPR|nr:unnamed protein product [Paramecium primaurelia]